MELVADIIVDRVVESLDHPFTYRIPPHLKDDMQPGQLVSVPFGRGRVLGIVHQLRSSDPGGLKDVESIRRIEPVLTPALLDLADWMAERYLCYRSQAIRAMIPAAVRQERGVRPSQVWYRAAGDRQGRASLTQTVHEYIQRHGPVDRRTIVDVFPAALPALRSLVREGALEVLHRPPEVEPGSARPYPLTADQSAAIAKIRGAPEEPWLIEGVTGSGKTEVYLSLIEAVLHNHRQALVLLPEISLTPQTVLRFRQRFGGGVAVWHSGLAQSERHGTWDAVRQGTVTVVVGARSAVFLPFRDLGIIVLDEEHEPTYKQEEHPRYHTRDVALWRGRREGAAVVLGSATPAVETRHMAITGTIGHVVMPARVLGRELPEVSVVDMRDELRAGNRDIFSGLLQRALKEAFDAQEQAILFLNRRGYSTFVLCRSCGEALECPDCSVSLTYHQREERLFCHYCLRDFPMPATCPECGSDKIRYFGAGTERVAAEVERLFPGVRTLRADRDTLTRPQDYTDLYQAFYRGDADVLVGTQMIAKGMDFPKVRLVGVVAADTSLHLPDFRSSERTFQLLVQAGGRSGRGESPGRVVVQTYNPEHYAVALAQTHDYGAFFTQEIEYRRAAGYPPFAELWLLVFESIDEARARQVGREVAAELRGRWPDLDVLGPAPAPLRRVRGRYRFHVLIKRAAASGTDARQVAHALKALAAEHRMLSITRDPYFLM